ncbi:hypothetical protein [Microcoleus sp. FACHB-68]|uniref:hypothetical protein n=1 Tax=Microcoleus sp. FACHB-68 TaxID=2692826 RepID=UPI00168671F8|nr:hypothetical protein [Microcoleus sp. FACHB-68]MBD1938148.1 hypothetical protein [Microcoleus sp. FACHB-68]
MLSSLLLPSRYEITLVAILALAGICTPAPSTAMSLSDSISPASLGVPAVAATPPPAAKPQPDPFAEGVRSAIRAANLAQTAKSLQEWNDVAVAWLEAAAWMQAVPPASPKRAFAQKKVVEYLRNFTIAQQKAAGKSSNVPFPTFNSEVLDEQLLLYLSYLAAIGPPDILIVGSSRALQGVDPRALQQALAQQGYPGLQIFNFAVNGATAQVVDFQLRQLLTPQQLPRLILWADGARAFNSGRQDRTYNAILSSPGYQRLVRGNRPRLSLDEIWQRPQLDVAAGITETDFFDLTNKQFNEFEKQLDQKLEDSSFHASLFNFQFLDEPVNTIDANGFLSVSNRFNPAIYYRQNPRVSGLYDSDYTAFQFKGQQAAALNDIVYFTNTRNIPLIFVNLPLTQDYLDPTRKSAEQQFVQNMQRQANAKGFIFRNLSQKNLTQNNNFSDPSHLNLFGAAAVAKQLAQDANIPWPRNIRN